MCGHKEPSLRENTPTAGGYRAAGVPGGSSRQGCSTQTAWRTRTNKIQLGRKISRSMVSKLSMRNDLPARVDSAPDQHTTDANSAVEQHLSSRSDMAGAAPFYLVSRCPQLHVLSAIESSPE